MLHRCLLRGLPLLTATAIAYPAMGLSIRDDLTFTPYETQVNTSPYSASGQFNTSHSGTLIAPNWVLASAHGGNAATFTASDGTVANVIQRIVFPGDTSAGNAFDGNDFALFQLDASINSVTAATLHDPTATGVSYVDLLTDITNLTAVYGGGGETGTGDVGAAASGSRDILAGTNIIDSTGYDFGSGTISNIAVSDFDSPSTFGPDNDAGTSLEMGLANRDSGGGLWVDIGDGPVLIGVHSGITDDGDGILGEYGQLNFSTVLTTDAYNWAISTVPEPTSLAMLVLGGALLARRRR